MQTVMLGETEKLYADAEVLAVMQSLCMRQGARCLP